MTAQERLALAMSPSDIPSDIPDKEAIRTMATWQDEWRAGIEEWKAAGT